MHARVKFRGQFVGFNSLIPPCGSELWNYDRQAPLPAKPAHRPPPFFFRLTLTHLCGTVRQDLTNFRQRLCLLEQGEDRVC